MKIQFFDDTDTALLELRPGRPAETRELPVDIHPDLDASDHVVSITLEHASVRDDLPEVGFKRIKVPMR
ncbi:MAG: DUF2283 domain-containing protein [Verrucomicrobiales bacterium]|nr:DUF2283 domain-containing protein [Verrucomicrobiales bacterium]